jgi:ribosome maturation factor RimP
MKPKLFIFIAYLLTVKTCGFKLSSFIYTTQNRVSHRASLRLPLSNSGQADYLLFSNFSTEKIIKQAAAAAGASPKQIDIQIKGQRITVTVKGKATISADCDVQDQYLLEFSEEEKVVQNETNENTYENTSLETEEIDIYSVTRSINEALRHSGELGEYISNNFEIEVTTPGVSEILPEGYINSYKGFDILVDTCDKVSGKKQTIQGILVERSEEMTILNIKGRTRKLKNTEIEYTRLPKPKT